MSRGESSFFRPKSRGIKEEPNQIIKIDKVDVACNIQVERVCKLEGVYNTEWGRTLIDCLKPKNPHSWCGGDGKEKTAKKSRGGSHLKKKEAEEIEELSKGRAPLFQLCKAHSNLWVQYFKVPKRESINEEGVKEIIARIITSCRQINELFGKPPTLRLPSIASIFKVIGAFDDPWFLTLDFRHWFYQIPLHPSIRKFFTVKLMDKRLFNLLALPMGFSWSPWIAQGISMAIIYETRAKWTREEDKHLNVVPQKEYEEVVTFWRTTAEGEAEKVAFAIAWYDNILVVGKDKETTSQIHKILAQVTSSVGAVVKGSSHDHFLASLREEAEGDIHSAKKKASEFKDPDRGGAGWTLSHGAVEYMGIEFCKTVGGVTWKHISSNISTWKLKLEYKRKINTSGTKV